MANTKAVPITEEDLTAVNDLLRELKQRAQQAHQRNNTLLLGVYADLIKVVSPRVTRLHARVEREDMADFNKRHKSLRKAEREAQASQASRSEP